MRGLCIALTVVAFLVGGEGAAHACFCSPSLIVPWYSQREASFKGGAVIFLGTVVEVIPDRITVKQPDNSSTLVVKYRVRFAVKEAFRGVTDSSLTTDNGSGPGDCSYGPMLLGGEYLVYASRGLTVRVRVVQHG